MAGFSASTVSAAVYLNPLVWVLWLLDFALWLLLPPWNLILFLLQLFRGGYSYMLKGSDNVRHKKGVKELLETPIGGCSTVHELMQESFSKHGPYKAMGTRTFKGWHTPKGGKFPLKKFGDTKWQSYAEVSNRSSAFGRGLRALGMEPLPIKSSRACTEEFLGLNGKHCLLIFEETCADWMTAALGAMSQSLPIATSYSTLGIDAVGVALNQTNAPVILCNYKDVNRVLELKSKCANLTTIIYTMNYTEESEKKHATNINGIDILSFNDVVELGNKPDWADIGFKAPTAQHIALIMYTSGSTGTPKGVMLKHKSVVAAVGGMFEYISAWATPSSNSAQEVYLAYLPAAHILEFAVETGMLVFGAAVGYSDPKTISSKGAVRVMPDGSLNGEPTGYGNYPPGGIQEFAPTFMAAVPKIWDILKKGVESVVGKGSPVVKTLFVAAFAARSLALKQGRSSPLLSLIFKKTYKMLGGRLKLCVSGGGPVSSEIQNFIRVAFKVNLVQGYGLTETCAAGTVQMFEDCQDGVVGPPVASAEIKLADCADVLDREGKPYLSTDTEHYGTSCLGRGESWIRGPAVSSGYYMQEKKTKEEFDDEGWFHTGDICIWTADGQLKIVDRKKNLIKLKGGEYVAIESMEATYAESVYVNGVNGGIMCYADGDMDRPVALVQVNDVELKKWAKDSGVSYSTIEELCENEEAIKLVTKDLNAIGKGKLGGNEALASVCLLPGTGDPTKQGSKAPWSPENTFLTASNKLNRKPIEMGFQNQLAAVKKKGIR